MLTVPPAIWKNGSAPYPAYNLGNDLIKEKQAEIEDSMTPKNNKNSSSIQRLQYLAIRADAELRGEKVKETIA